MSKLQQPTTGGRWRRARIGAVAVGAFALAVPVMGAATSTASQPNTVVTTTRPYCGLTWGSLPERASQHWSGAVTGIRSGQHTCYDRIVFDVATGSGRLGYDVRYVNAVTSPTTGLPVPVAGGARLQVTVNAPATMRVPSSGRVDYPGYRTLRQLKWVTSFEGETDFGLGVRARLPMRVFTLDSPGGGQRLVIDVAHRW